MEIQVRCANGHKLTAREKLFGKKVLCPKCKVEVQIPVPKAEVIEPEAIVELTAVEPADPLATDPLAADPLAVDPLGSPLQPDPLAGNPLGGDPLAGDPLAGDPLAGDLSNWESLGDVNAAMAAPAVPATPMMPAAQVARAPAPASRPASSSAKPATRSPKMLMFGLAAGGGALVGLLFVTLFAWWLLGDGGSSPGVPGGRPGGDSTVAAAPTKSAEGSGDRRPKVPQATGTPPTGIGANPAGAAATVTPAAAATTSADPATPTDSQPATESKPQKSANGFDFAPLASGSQPLDLQPLDVDQRLASYTLPGTTWATAYDAASGRLVVTNDQAGFIIYDLDDVAAGKPSPASTIATQGFPTAACFKQVKDKLLLVLAAKDSPTIRVFDANSLQPAGEVKVERATYIGFLAGSPNPQDPFVYYCTERGDPNARVAEIEKTTANSIGRINLETMKWDGQTGGKGLRGNEIIPSADGELLYTRYANGSIYGHDSIGISTWSDHRDSDGFVQLATVTNAGSNYTSSLMSDKVGQRMATGYRMYSRLGFRSYVVDFEIKAFFRQQPLVAGIFKDNIVIGSANNHARLETIPLPASWFPEERKQPNVSDFRYRPKLTVSLMTQFLSVDADDTRRLAVYVFKNQLVVVPLARLNLPVEESLLVANRPPQNLKVGEDVSVTLDGNSSKAKVEMVTTLTEKELNEEYGRAPLGSQRPGAGGTPAGGAATLSLAAALNSEQTEFFVNDLSPLLDRAFPQTIQIDDERMIVVGVDTFKTALRVKRTEGKAHSVSASVVRVMPGGAPPASPSSQPVTSGREFRWTPSPDHLGRQTLHMRAKSGKLQHDWYWDVMVEHPSVKLPFYVTAAEVSAEGDLAVVWGRSMPEEGKSVDQSAPTMYYIGVYDVAKRELLKYRELSVGIMSATIDKNGVYTSIAKAPSNAKEKNAGAAQIVKLDLEKLEVAKQVSVQSPCGRLEILGNRYLAAYGQSVYRFSLPDLKPVPTAITPQTGFIPVAARLGEKWIWDGVIWDADLTTPRLMLFPLLFGIVPNERSHEPWAGQFGSVLIQPTGAFACTYNSNDPNSPTPIGSRVELPKILPPEVSPDVLNKELRGSVGKGVAVQSAFGKMYVSPFELPPDEAGFRFDEKQSTFVLATDKPNTVTYSAPSASRYQLFLWIRQPDAHDFDDQFLFMKAESSDGSFKITIPSDEQLLSLMHQSVSGSHFASTATAKDDVVQIYTKAVTPAFRALTGRAPQGIPFPVYAVVFAASEDGFQKAGLAHSYLVEVPIKKYQDFAKRVMQQK